MAVIAAILVSVGSLVSVAVRGTHALDDHLVLVETARAIEAGLPDRDSLTVGTLSGERDGQCWRVDVTPVARRAGGAVADALGAADRVDHRANAGRDQPQRHHRAARPKAIGMKKRKYSASHGEAGFTLIEMLVALVLMVGILAALATVTAQWLPNWNRGFAHVQRTELFGRRPRTAGRRSCGGRICDGERQVQAAAVRRRRTGRAFCAHARSGPIRGPVLKSCSVSTLSDDRGVALVRTRAPFLPLPENGKIRDLANFADPVVLMRAPYRAVFSYAGPDHVWQNSWRDADHLPVAIRVSVRDAATQHTLAVSTATVLRVSVAAACAARQDRPRNASTRPR